MKKIRSRVELLSEEEITLIHKSSLRLLEKTGMRVPNRKVCQLAAGLGAKVDENRMVVRIPGQLMEELLQLLRSTNCEAREDTDSVTPVTGNVSTQVFMVDCEKQTRRYGTMDDVMDGIALIQSLQNIPLANAVVVPHDVPHEISDVLCYQNIYKYSRKPGGTYILTPQSANSIIAMSEVMDRKVSYLFDTVSPLSFAENSLEIALIFREQNLEMTMTPMVMAGSTGPVTIAGTLALQNAEALGSLFFIYVLTGKFPKYVASGHSNDIRRNMICSFGSPNQALIGVGAAQMAHYYGLKSGSNSGLSDSVVPDFQCGFEKALSASYSCLAGSEAIGGQGIVGADQGMSFAQLVIDNEWLDAFNYVNRGIEVTEDSIGLETIEEVGIGGNFLAEEHTVEYMRESFWDTQLFERDVFDNLVNKKHNLLREAEEKARQYIVQNRVSEPVVEAKIASELDYIAQQAYKDYTHSPKH